MTIASTTTRNRYSGNGSTTVFGYEFRINDKSHVKVYIADEDDEASLLTVDTDYTVSGVGDEAGGNVTLGDLTSYTGSEVLPTGWTVTLIRVPPILQETALANQGPFFARTHEGVFDYLTMISQYLQEQLDRAVKVSVTSGETGEVIAEDFLSLVEQATAARDAAEAAETEAEAAQAGAEAARDAAQVQWRFGEGAPDSALGIDGDNYADELTWDIYRKESGTWDLKGSINGEDGKTILNGDGVPDPSLGNEGDFYLDTTDQDIYGPKTGAGWGSGTTLKGADGTNGTNGEDGQTILNGEGAPDPALGEEGDFYIDTSGSEIYGPKTGAGWGTGTSIVGPEGPAGSGSGDVLGPATHGANRVPQWQGVNNKTLKEGLAVGTAASNLVQLDGDAKLPAVDGSQLTQLAAGGVSVDSSGFNKNLSADDDDVQKALVTIDQMDAGGGAGGMSANKMTAKLLFGGI